MEIYKLSHKETGHFIDLIEIFKQVFEDDRPVPPSQYLNNLLHNQNFMVFVATVNNKVVGGLTIYVLHQYYCTKPIAYIYDVAVKPEFQGKSIGKALISEACNYCKENGFDEAYVEAESNDVDAVNFYRKTNFIYETNAIHFTYSLKNQQKKL